MSEFYNACAGLLSMTKQAVQHYYPGRISRPCSTVFFWQVRKLRTIFRHIQSPPESPRFRFPALLHHLHSLSRSRRFRHHVPSVECHLQCREQSAARQADLTSHDPQRTGVLEGGNQTGVHHSQRTHTAILKAREIGRCVYICHLCCERLLQQRRGGQD